MQCTRVKFQATTACPTCLPGRHRSASGCPADAPGSNPGPQPSRQGDADDGRRECPGDPVWYLTMTGDGSRDEFGRARQSKQQADGSPVFIQEELMPSTIQVHRVVRASTERVYRAFLDADAMAKWLPPNGFTGKVHHLDARVGGTYRMSFTNFTSGRSHSFGGKYLELVPQERIRHTDVFDDPNLPGEMLVTVTLKSVSVGTELHILQEGVPDVIPAEACYLGWQESLTLLAQLVEADIPD